MLSQTLASKAGSLLFTVATQQNQESWHETSLMHYRVSGYLIGVIESQVKLSNKSQPDLPRLFAASARVCRFLLPPCWWSLRGQYICIDLVLASPTGCPWIWHASSQIEVTLATFNPYKPWGCHYIRASLSTRTNRTNTYQPGATQQFDVQLRSRLALTRTYSNQLF